MERPAEHQMHRSWGAFEARKSLPECQNEEIHHGLRISSCHAPVRVVHREHPFEANIRQELCDAAQSEEQAHNYRPALPVLAQPDDSVYVEAAVECSDDYDDYDLCPDTSRNGICQLKVPSRRLCSSSSSSRRKTGFSKQIPLSLPQHSHTKRTLLCVPNSAPQTQS